MVTDVDVRLEQPVDLPAIRAVNLAAFPEAAEANLVDELRANGKATLSLVAVQDDRIVGHILFSPVTMDSNDAHCRVLGLGPMAVFPDLQGQGVGSMLVRAGLDHCKQDGVGCIVVLGHPALYPRFGFKTASQFGIGCQYDVPSNYFMVAEMAEGALSSISGIARYEPEFAQV
jgi:putative acetyltransferase